MQCGRHRLDPWVGKIPGEGNDIHSSILAWGIPQTEETVRLQSLESQRVGHYWVTNTILSLVQIPLSFLHYLGTTVKKSKLLGEKAPIHKTDQLEEPDYTELK